MNTAPTSASHVSGIVVRRFPPACDLVPEFEHGAEIHRACNLGAGFPALDRQDADTRPLRLRKCAVQHIGYDETKNVVAEKFEPLIAGSAVSARQRRNMRQRTFKQILVGKFVADPVFERGPVLRLAAHLTIVSSLLQRTDTGQRQNCQARSPS
jgi:hypothetical protein